VILLAALAAFVGGGDPSIVPIPIGPGPRYRPAAIVRDGTPVGKLTCGEPGATFRVHIELFAKRLVVVVPQGIGVAGNGCVYPVRTIAPTGVVEVERGAKLTLGDLFRIWGGRLGTHTLLSFTSKQPVQAFVAGRRYAGPAAAIPLTPNAQVVVEIGGYVPPHRTYLFPKRRAS
jgi:hypothetical protein